MNERGEKIKNRMEEVRRQYMIVLALDGPAKEDFAWCMGWMSTAISLIKLAYQSASDANILNDAVNWYNISSDENGSVSHSTAARIIYHLLNSAIAEIEFGLIGSVERDVSARTFDDLLDHAEAYLQEGRKEPAGVLTGVVFEDTTRKIGKLHAVENEKLDAVISGLASKNVFTGIEAKQARTCAALRTTATHASWDEFAAADVERAISFTKQIILTKLAG